MWKKEGEAGEGGEKGGKVVSYSPPYFYDVTIDIYFGPKEKTSLGERGGEEGDRRQGRINFFSSFVIDSVFSFFSPTSGGKKLDSIFLFCSEFGSVLIKKLVGGLI